MFALLNEIPKGIFDGRTVIDASDASERSFNYPTTDPRRRARPISRQITNGERSFLFPGDINDFHSLFVLVLLMAAVLIEPHAQRQASPALLLRDKSKARYK